jgi:hypothetical protein
MFCTDSANILINPRTACCETEKGGEGERYICRTVGDVLSCAHYSLRQPASPACQTGGRRCSGEHHAPPLTQTPFQQFEAIAVDL